MNKKARQLNALNNMLDSQISEENQEQFTDMICYLRGANISEYDVEVVRQDLTEKVLSAQKRGQDIKSVIGEDYKTFCDNVIAGLPPRTLKQKVVDIVSTFCLALSVVLAINTVISKEMFDIVKGMFSGKQIDVTLSVSVGKLISTLLIVIFAYVITITIMKSALRKESNYKKSLLFLSGCIVFGVLVFIAWVGRETAFTMNIFYAYAIIFGLYVVHKLLENV